MQTLRSYQERDLEAIREHIRAGKRSILYVLPTGGGKTTVSSAMIEGMRQRGKRCWFLAHRIELLEQCSERLQGLGVSHGIIVADDPRARPWEMVHVASVPTLARRGAPPNLPDVIVVDECHRAPATSYRKVLAYAPNAVVIGLTATPIRLDGKGLGDLFQVMVQGPTIQELTEQGHLVSARHYCPEAPDLSDVGTSKGDYKTTDLSKVMDRPKLVGDIIQQWRQRADGRSTIAFGVDVSHSEHIAAEFRAAGIPAEHVDGETSPELRRAALARFKRRETLVISNVGLFTEGFDAPWASCAIFARPTQSLALYLQMAGRVLRPSPGKADAILLDHAGCGLEHGGVAAARGWSLETTPKKRSRTAMPRDPRDQIRVCPECSMVWPRAKLICEAPLDDDLICGYEFASRQLDHDKTGELSMIATDAAPKKSAYTIRKLSRNPIIAAIQRRAAEKGYKPGWVYGEVKRRGLTWGREMGAAQ